jgi:hypothetical protein
LETEETPVRNLFDYVEGLLNFLPEAVGWMAARTPAGFGTIAEKLLARAVDHLESNGKHFRTSSEDNITSATLGFLNAYGIQATSQTNSRGHVDIYLKHAWQPRLAICGEAKIWRGAAHHIGGLAQVLGYSTGRYPFCFVLAYVQTGQIKTHIATLRTHLDTTLPERQQGPCASHATFVWGLTANHLHSSGELVRVLHAGVNLA